MCDNRRPRILGQVGVFMFAEKRLRQSIKIAAAVLFVNIPVCFPPLQFPVQKRRIAHWPLQSESRVPVLTDHRHSGPHNLIFLP